jgi:hypothetical protein
MGAVGSLATTAKTHHRIGPDADAAAGRDDAGSAV